MTEILGSSTALVGGAAAEVFANAAELEAMQQQVADTAPQAQSEFVLRLPDEGENRHRRFIEKHLARREAAKAEKAERERLAAKGKPETQAALIAAAKEKRARRAALRCQGGR